jgi:hypothetical protein
MQAADLSKHLRDHFDRALDGYSEAFALADAAVTIAPSRDYGRWSDLRSRSFHAQKHVRILIAERSAQGAAAAS